MSELSSKINRRQLLGLGVGLIFALGYESCDPTTSQLPPSNSGTVLPNQSSNIYTFNFATYPQLQSEGGSVEIGVNAGSGQKLISIVMGSLTTAYCVQMVCSLAFCYLQQYNLATAGYSCPCHGCRFNADGSVANGPATQPLTTYTVAVSSTSLSVTIP